MSPDVLLKAGAASPPLIPPPPPDPPCAPVLIQHAGLNKLHWIGQLMDIQQVQKDSRALNQSVIADTFNRANGGAYKMPAEDDREVNVDSPKLTTVNHYPGQSPVWQALGVVGLMAAAFLGASLLNAKPDPAAPAQPPPVVTKPAPSQPSPTPPVDEDPGSEYDFGFFKP